jgi:hypothetical protein
MSSINTISLEQLTRLIGTPKCPALIDVRPDDEFTADPRLLPAALRRSHAGVQQWAQEFFERSVIVICQRGQQLGHGVAACYVMTAYRPTRSKAASMPGSAPICRLSSRPGYRRETS